jgi:hypothetical protein
MSNIQRVWGPFPGFEIARNIIPRTAARKA